jgi:6-pyruvoyltetrahydropterin/6-carboxytetrahydropterin synthase
MFLLSLGVTFNASHAVGDECVHGHTFGTDIRIQLAENRRVNTKLIREFILKKYDHADINKIISAPTAETLAVEIWNDIQAICTPDNAVVISVTVHEGNEYSTTYIPGE